MDTMETIEIQEGRRGFAASKLPAMASRYVAVSRSGGSAPMPVFAKDQIRLRVN